MQQTVREGTSTLLETDEEKEKDRPKEFPVGDTGKSGGRKVPPGKKGTEKDLEDQGHKE